MERTGEKIMIGGMVAIAGVFVAWLLYRMEGAGMTGGYRTLLILGGAVVVTLLAFGTVWLWGAIRGRR
jgi:hypothetical protein